MIYSCAMVDLETLADQASLVRRPDGAILRVGIVPFSLEVGAECVASREEWFDMGLTRDRNLASGRHADMRTTRWWERQSVEAVQALLTPPMADSARKLADAIRRYLAGALFTLDLALWANPPQFDLVLLKDLLDAEGQPWPVQRRGELCVRTLKTACEGLGLPGPDPALRGLAHSAAEDAAWQATEVVWYIRELRRLGR